MEKLVQGYPSPEEQQLAGQLRMGTGNILPRKGTIEPSKEQEWLAGPIFDGSRPLGKQFVGYHTPPQTHQVVLEVLGFRFGSPVDAQLISATLPPWWSVRTDEQNVFVTRLYDGQGRERGTIFFKAAFYDYAAHVIWLPRYSCRTWYAARGDLPERQHDLGGEMAVCSVVHDRMTGANVYWSVSYPYYREYRTLGEEGYEAYRDYYATRTAAERAAREYLQTTYPRHDDPFAYWDDVRALFPTYSEAEEGEGEGKP